MPSRRKDINWNIIQQDYNSGLSMRDIQKKYNVSNGSMQLAAKRGDIVYRNKSQARKNAAKTKPQTLSEQHKKNISVARIKYLDQNPDKVPYRLNHYSKGKSYPEQYFSDLFKSLGYKFEEEFPVSIYSLDFANVSAKINIEIDGDQHYLDKRISDSDEKRTKYLESLGWKTIRIRWSNYQKLSYNERQDFLNTLLGRWYFG